MLPITYNNKLNTFKIAVSFSKNFSSKNRGPAHIIDRNIMIDYYIIVE